MKRFLKRFSFFVFPLLLLVLLAEYLLRKIPNDYSFKAGMYEEHGDNIKTLILGNSCAYYGLDPAFFSMPTFNGAHVAQTLDLDAKLFSKFENKLTGLKYVIMPISDMSFFFKLSHSDESWRIKNYSIYYKIHPTNKFADYFEVLNIPWPINRNRLISYYVKHQSSITSSNLGYGTNYNSKFNRNLADTSLEDFKMHSIKDFNDSTEEKKSLEEIISICKNKNIKVILFIAPAYSTYVSNIDPYQLKTTINTCEYFKQSYDNVCYSNLLNDTIFNEKDYFDAVHLNEIGAKKLSLKINAIISNLENKNF